MRAWGPGEARTRMTPRWTTRSVSAAPSSGGGQARGNRKPVLASSAVAEATVDSLAVPTERQPVGPHEDRVKNFF